MIMIMKLVSVGACVGACVAPACGTQPFPESNRALERGSLLEHLDRCLPSYAKSLIPTVQQSKTFGYPRSAAPNVFHPTIDIMNCVYLDVQQKTRLGLEVPFQLQ
jgi:hypothetical protein